MPISVGTIETPGPLITGLEIASQFLERVDLENSLRRPIILRQIDLQSASGNTQDVLNTLLDIGVVKPIDDRIVAQTTGIPSPFRIRSHTSPAEQSKSDIRTQYDRFIQNHQWTEALEIAELLYDLTDEEGQNTLLEKIKTDLSLGGQLRRALGITEHLADRLTEHPMRLLSNQIDLAVLHTRLGNRDQAIEQYNA